MIYSANYGLKEPQKNVDLADVNDINYNTEAIDGIMHNTQISLAPAYDHTLTYDVGDLVMYETLLYECITAVTTPEAWDSTKWQRAYLSENAGGGGGNANVTELTYNQYLALSQAEKTNGTIYMVTDDPSDSSSGGGGGGVDYSTTEQDTGLKWVDGKPIYQKTYHIMESNEEEEKDYDISSDNVDTMIGCEAVVKSGVWGGNKMFTVPRIGDGSYFISASATNTAISIKAKSYKYTEAYVTLRYTKVTSVS